MSDPFIDALHNRLRQADAGSAARLQDEGAAALTGWWAEFVEVLGQKVGAWNERQAPRPPLNFTKRAGGEVHVWHRSAEATFVRDGEVIRVATRIGAAPPRESTITVQVGSNGTLVALADGAPLSTPSAAAEHLLTPVLVETFANP